MRPLLKPCYADTPEMRLVPRHYFVVELACRLGVCPDYIGAGFFTGSATAWPPDILRSRHLRGMLALLGSVL